MSTATRLMTADELLIMPHGDFRYELVKGELRQMSPSAGPHGIVVARLTGALVQHVEAHDLGEVFGAETGFKLESDPDTVRAPDVSFISRERLPAGDFPGGFWTIPPDLAVEVLSPDDRPKQVAEKIAQYFAAGVRAVWVADAKRRTFTMHRVGVAPVVLTEEDEIDGGDIVPGFRYKVAKLFARIPR